MSEVADRYRLLSGGFVDRVSQVSPEQWASPLREAFVQVQADLDGQTTLLALLGRHV
ncbi:MAG TPA: hypothetical protein VM282_25560 [Acidimicrobiales bacterium]|nr:hypothetical protein [Acidimicrobiales bacterium]